MVKPTSVFLFVTFSLSTLTCSFVVSLPLIACSLAFLCQFPSTAKILTAMVSPQAMELPRKLWEHSNPKSTEMYKFMQKVNRKHGLNLMVRTANRSLDSPTF